MIDRRAFFGAVRKAPANGFLSSAQVDGFTHILDEWDARKLTEPRWLAYMLATCWHETDTKMQPVREAGSDAYLRGKPYWPWTGRGLVQVTWEANARKFGAKVPDDLLSWPVALRALFDGMIEGVFTGHRLGQHFNGTTNDPVGARRIINGTDRASLIAGYHAGFLAAIGSVQVAREVEAPAPAPVPVAPAPPAPKPIEAPVPIPPAWTLGGWLAHTFFRRPTP